MIWWTLQQPISVSAGVAPSSLLLTNGEGEGISCLAIILKARQTDALMANSDRQRPEPVVPSKNGKQNERLDCAGASGAKDGGRRLRSDQTQAGLMVMPRSVNNASLAQALPQDTESHSLK